MRMGSGFSWWGADRNMPAARRPDKADGALVARRVTAGEIERLRQGGAAVEQQRRLVVFADYVCPFCYLAESALTRLRRAHGVEVEAAAFELRPPGSPLSAVDVPWPREDWQAVVLPLAAELKVPITYPSLSTRTRKAHEAVAYARSVGLHEPLHEALYRAYWEDSRDIGRIDVLMEIGAAVGLDRTALKVALDIDQWTDRVVQNRVSATQLGLTAVPAYLLHARGGDGPVTGELRVGMQRYDELRAWVVRDDI
jgi:predicted DsbA family dithiol-disulfide isomerase